jgi:hypothetical protein
MAEEINDKPAIYDAFLTQADEALRQRGEFLPLAIAVTHDGQFHLTVASGFDSAHEGFQTLLTRLQQRAHNSEIRSAGLCVNATATLPNSTEASAIIAVLIEEEQGATLEIWKPYEQQPDASIVYGEAIALQGTRRVFA